MQQPSIHFLHKYHKSCMVKHWSWQQNAEALGLVNALLAWTIPRQSGYGLCWSLSCKENLDSEDRGEHKISAWLPSVWYPFQNAKQNAGQEDLKSVGSLCTNCTVEAKTDKAS